ncbi:recombination directionality factor (plasmid) [Cupriavidus basilensis]
MEKSILSDRLSNGTARQNISGRIRSGTKLLTATAAKNPKAVALFAPALAGVQKFKDAEAAIASQCNIAHPTRPVNTPHFNVSGADFEMPEFARHILDTYGEQRGDDIPRLYRFPIVFHTDQLLDFFPHAFKSYGGAVNYESRYGADGKRYCMYREPVTPEQVREQRAKRMKFHPRRELVPRGECMPDSCPEYLQGLCKFRGELQFYIPGIPTVGPVSIATTSQYAAEGIFTDLMRIKDALGTIPRFNPFQPGKPIYWLTKVQETRTYYDELGAKRLGQQWVPKLTADLDMAKALSLNASPSRSLGFAPAAPQTWLAEADSASAVPSTDGDQGGPDAYDAKLQADVLGAVNDSNGDPELISRWATLRYGEAWSRTDSALSGVRAVFRSLGADGEYVNARLCFEIAALNSGIEETLRKQYFKVKLGNGWTHNVDTLAAAEAELAALTPRGVNYASSLMLSFLDDQTVGA